MTEQERRLKVSYETRNGEEYVSQYSVYFSNLVMEWLVEQNLAFPDKKIRYFGKNAGELIEDLEKGQMLRQTYEGLITRIAYEGRRKRKDELAFPREVI